MKIRLLNPITHDGTHYTRGVYDIDDDLANALLGIHSQECTSYEPANPKAMQLEKPNGECRNHPAVPFVRVDELIGVATPAADAKKSELSKALADAGVDEEQPRPDSSKPGVAAPAVDASAPSPKKKQ